MWRGGGGGEAVTALRLFGLAVIAAVWFAAGYRAGLERGRGWVGAAVRSGCGLVCPQPERPRPGGKRL